ncbi:hypothetical protein [Streptomyces sp. NPDC002044]|uniref:hypothetical protein n=1 Tax=Streptomyces sp. NPDC002044 TaxID=3154662 RepID=UPI0033331453
MTTVVRERNRVNEAADAMAGDIRAAPAGQERPTRPRAPSAPAPDWTDAPWHEERRRRHRVDGEARLTAGV